ncbi:MAG: 30S ribosomal protein S6e [Candidatus Marsarchaeota archaeon]|nr:30S ribosomal protein S6e [Candidatus Marsarchaeota archaeon]
MKVVYSDAKSGRTAQMELPADRTVPLLNKKIGETIDGSVIDLVGYKLKITGGSDKSGFPMEKSLEGTAKTKVMKKIADSGRQKGQYKRMMVRGNMINADTEQVNLMIVEYGEKPVEELFPKKEKAEKPKAEEKAKA